MTEVLSVLKYIWNHRANNNRRLTAIIYGITWQLYKRITGRHFDIKIFNNIKIRCYPNSTSASSLIYCSGMPDFHEMRFMKDYLRKGDGFIDVGANIGAYTLLAASLVGSSGRVDSFEPGKVAFKRLKENIELNNLSQVHLHPIALGDVIGSVHFLCEQDTTNRIYNESDLSKKFITVPSDRLDNILSMENYVMGNIDIEGAELLALRGATKMLSEHNPAVWLLEFNGALHSFGFSEQEFSDWLSNQGYDLALYDSDNRIMTYELQPWLKSENVFAISRKKKDQVLHKCKTI
jgi:FkbM family methyltransferase